MPSLQQFNRIANDSVGTSMGKTHAMRSSMSETAGTELLQKHSINSIIEQRQDFLNRHCGSSDANIMDGIHHDGGGMVSETCANAMASATQHTLSLTDPLVMTANYLDLSGNARRSCTGEKRHLANVNLSLSNHVLAIDGVGAAAKSNLHNASNASVLSKATDVFSHNATNSIMPLIGSNYMPLTPSSTQSSISPVTQTTNSFDIFQFGNIAPSLSSSPQHQHQHQSHQQQQATLTTAAAQNNALPLKAFQRNISNFDCTAPLSPSTPTSLYNNSFQSSPLVSDNSNSSPASGQPVDLMPLTYQNGCPKNSIHSTRSTSPESQNSNQSNENNLIDMMTFLNTGSTQQQQHQQNVCHKANNGEQHYEMAQFSNKKEQQKDVTQNSSYASNIAGRDIVQSAKDQTLPLPAMDNLNFDNLDILSIFDMDLTKWQNLNVATILRAQQQVPLLQNLIQTYNTINQLQNWQLQHQQQQQQQQQQTQVPPLLNNGINQLSNTNNTDNGSSDAYLDRIAKFYRGSAAFREPTYTWSGQLPPRSHRLHQFSPKVFLGGIPWDISEESLVQIFKPFGQIKVEWPGKELQAAQPKGYVYVIFESDKQVKALLSACVVQMDIQHNGSGLFYFKISSRRIKAKDVEVIPWWIGDSNYVKSTSQKLDPTKTVFVGALHGKLTAEGLARIMDDLFDGVVYAGIDTDKYKYPIGSGRVTFNNNRSYMKAVSAAFIEIRATKFTKKVQIDPYLEDSLCSICGVQHGPYYCRELSCFRYFCRTCWQWQHSTEAVKFHKPLTRNAKSQSLIGLGPAISTASLSSLHTHNSVNFGNLQQQPMQSHLRKQLNATRSLNSLETILQPHHQQQQPLATAATSTTPQQLQNLHNAFRL